MYVPDAFRLDDVGACHAMMRAHPFAILVGHGADAGLFATHQPTVLASDQGAKGVIEAHFARPNPHWRMFQDGAAEGLFIFSGPHGYIHPGWYPTKQETGKAVPTWNYATVHAYGRAEIITDEAWLRRHVAALTDQQETDYSDPWKLSDAPESFTQVMLRGIVGLRFEITRLEGKRKMSQNRPQIDRDGVVVGLRATGSDMAAAVATEVETAAQDQT
jgi:transcriptional regulator